VFNLKYLEAVMVGTQVLKSLEHRTLDQIERDEEGFLLDANRWHPSLIEALTAEAELELTPERLEIVLFIRSYFENNETVPETRTVLKHMKSVWGPDKATRRYLYQLFPYGYGQQACKIAGMRKPRKLMLDV
jgi:TusE/DsrC/DsvC family sulfur relay protein